MFTGIVEAKAKILQNTGSTITLERPMHFDDIRLGASISVSGVCLTITKFDQDSLEFDVVSETLQRTKLGVLVPGNQVNLERALKADQRLDGHVVQGHVEGVGTVLDAGLVLKIEFPAELSDFIVEKGSITIDGVSLTVAQKIDQKNCSIALIPETLHKTTLGELMPGDAVNIETDILGRYVAQLVGSNR